MHAYIISPNEQARPIYAGDLKEVRQVLRQRVTKDSRDWARVTLEDHPSDKRTFIALRNGQEVPPVAVLRKWRLNPRGALVEISVEED